MPSIIIVFATVQCYPSAYHFVLIPQLASCLLQPALKGPSAMQIVLVFVPHLLTVGLKNASAAVKAPRSEHLIYCQRLASVLCADSSIPHQRFQQQMCSKRQLKHTFYALEWLVALEDYTVRVHTVHVVTTS